MHHWHKGDGLRRDEMRELRGLLHMMKINHLVTSVGLGKKISFKMTKECFC